MQEFLNGILRFLSAQFTNICLIIGTIILISNTAQMNETVKKVSKDDSINQYFALNVTSIVFLGIFILAHFVVPYMKNN